MFETLVRRWGIQRKPVRRVAAVIAAALLAAAIVWHHELGNFAVSRTVSALTGYTLRFSEMRLQRDHGALLGARVTKNGDPVLQAARIDVSYSLRDLLPGSRHRFGLRAVSVNRPALTIIHHSDGTYNISGQGGGGTQSGGQSNGTPLAFSARVRDGSATLIDERQYYAESRLLRVHAINADVSVQPDRQHYVATGALVDKRDQPFRVAGTVDYTRNYALHHVSAAAIPLKAIGNYVINSPAAHILAGTAKDFQAQFYSLDVRSDQPVHYHLGATAKLADGQIYIHGLRKPLDSMQGTLRVFDGGFATPSLSATIASTPVRIAGGIYNFSNPQFRLGVQGTGDLTQLRQIVAFGVRQPVSGSTHIETLIEGAIANPLILVRFSSPSTRYGAIPLTDLRGVFALYDNEAEIIPLRAQYAGVAVTVRGRLALGKHIQSHAAIHLSANADVLPYASALVRGQELVSDAVIDGRDTAVGANGYFASTPDSLRANGLFNVTSRGVGTIGPLAIRSSDGGSLLAGYFIDRVANQSAFWASARGLHVSGSSSASLPGIALTALPNIGGTLDGDVAGGGFGSDIALGGRLIASGIDLKGVHITSAGARFAGTASTMTLGEVRADGSFGKLSGSGSYGAGGVAFEGNFDGSLQALSQFTGDIGARGRVRAPISMLSAGNDLVVQTHDAQFTQASIRGVPLNGFDGTVGYNAGRVDVYAARAQIAGVSAVAAGHFARNDSGSNVAFSASQLQAGALHALGAPITGGVVSVIGALGEGGGAPSFNGGLSVESGKVNGYPVAGNAELHFAQNSLDVRDASVALGKTYGRLSGRIAGVTSGTPQYALRAIVKGGDITSASHTLHLSTYGTTGSFDANLNIRGSGRSPLLSGPLSVPEGSINGLNFADARANVRADPGGVSAQGGTVLVGSTRAAFSAGARGSARTVALASQRADLADFNDYFNAGDTLGGRGSLDLHFAQNGHSISAAGTIDVLNLRYKRLPIGDTRAALSSVSNVITGRVSINGTAGTLRTSGTIAVAPAASLARTIDGSRYALRANLQDFDLNTWLPAFGYFSLPVTGRVDGTASVDGRYPRIAIGGNARLVGGTLGRIPVDVLTVAAREQGTRIAVTQLEARVPYLALRGSGTFGLGARDPIAFSAHGTSTSIRALLSEITGRTANLSGTLETDLRLSGNRENPQVTGGFDVAGASFGGVAVPSLLASLALRGRSLEVRSAQLALTKGTLFLAGSLPLRLSPFGIGPRTAPISLDLAARGIELSNFAPLLPPGSQLGGIIDGRIGVGGIARSPQIRGRMTVARGSFVGPFETVPVRNAGAIITFFQTTATLDSLHADLGGGRLDAGGKIAFDRGATQDQVTYRLDATARGASLNFPAYGRGTLNGAISLLKTTGVPLISGKVAVTDALVPFSALYNPKSGSGGDNTASPPLNLGFDLAVTAGKNVRVRGSGLDIGAAGQVLLGGTLAAPTLAGRFESTGGNLTYFDRSFKVQTGYVAFDPANGVIPQLHAIGKTRVINPDPNAQRNPTGSADITINVDGPITNLAITFDSSPPGYSREQILGMLTPLGIVSGITYSDNGVPTPPGSLRGAPAEGTGQPLPGVLVNRQTGNVTVGQEAFSILNAQFARGLLAPLEGALGGGLGLSDLNLSLDYGGGFGLNFRRILAHNFYAVYGSTFGYPMRQTFGFEYRPNEFTAGQLTFFTQQGASSIFSNARNQVSTNQRVTAGQPIEGTGGFSFNLLRLFP